MPLALRFSFPPYSKEHEIYLQEVYSYQTLVENLKPMERKLSYNLFETPLCLNHLHIDLFLNIFNIFIKKMALFIKLKKSFFERVLYRFPLLCVQSNVISFFLEPSDNHCVDHEFQLDTPDILLRCILSLNLH